MRPNEVDCPEAGAFPADVCEQRAITKGTHCFTLYCPVGNEMKKKRGLPPVPEDSPRTVLKPRAEAAVQQYSCICCGFTQNRSFVHPKDAPIPRPREAVCTVCFTRQCISHLEQLYRKAQSQKKKAFLRDQLDGYNRRLSIIYKYREKAEDAGCSS